MLFRSDGCGAIFGYETDSAACLSSCINTVTVYSSLPALTAGQYLYVLCESTYYELGTGGYYYYPAGGQSFAYVTPNGSSGVQYITTCSTADVFINNTDSLDISITGVAVNNISVTWTSGSVNFPINAGNNGQIGRAHV